MAVAKSVDESLWWDSFAALFEELDAVEPSSDIPDGLVEKLRKNHSWFLDSVSRFRPPNTTSKEALDSSQVSVGSHRLLIKPELKEAALRVSTSLCLDEVQSYILVNRSSELNQSVADGEGQDFLHLVLLRYYLERQCLLKCIRRIFMHGLFVSSGLHSTDAIREEALRLIYDGLNKKLLSLFQDLLSSVCLEKKEVDMVVLWIEEILIEDNLILDILFLSYYDALCTCTGDQWKTLCSLFKELLSDSLSIGMLAVSAEAQKSLRHAKTQLLLILMETLDLENLLRMVHDEIPVRQGNIVFSIADIQEMDAVVSSFSTLAVVEVGPLFLSWATFLCLLSSLPKSKEYNSIMDIDHIAHVRQAFVVGPFAYLHEVLCCDTLRDLDGPASGFLSTLRTFISGFIASYELTHQIGDNNTCLILDILCQIYHQEESLSMQFWDKESVVDGPIRSVLYMLESEFPSRTLELLRLLSALSEGEWSAECVYNFLDKMTGVTSVFQIPQGSKVLHIHDIVETCYSIPVPGVEGLLIPSGSHGYVLKIIDENLAMVRWEDLDLQPILWYCARSILASRLTTQRLAAFSYSVFESTFSGVVLLLLRLAQNSFSNNEEAFLTLNLLCRMISFSMAVSFSLLKIDKLFLRAAARSIGDIDTNVRIDVVKITCSLIVDLAHDVNNAGVVSICIKILALMLKCAPAHVIEVVTRENIFGTEYSSSLSNAGLLSGGFTRMLMADHVESDKDFPLTTSVLDFTLQLLETGAQNNMVAALVIFSLQYVLVNHVHWKFKLTYSRWKMTLKVFEVMRSCTRAVHVSDTLSCMVMDILLNDSSIHNILVCSLCISLKDLENLSLSGQHELKDIELVECVVCSALDIVFSLLANLSEEVLSSAPAFVQTLLSPATKPIPVVTVAISLISCHNSAIQVAAARVLSMLCFIGSNIQSYRFDTITFVANSLEIGCLNKTIYLILDEDMKGNEDLLIAIIDLLIYAARYQPVFLVSIMFQDEIMEAPLEVASDLKKQPVAHSVAEPLRSTKACLPERILQYLNKSEFLLNSSPRLLLGVLKLLKALWEGHTHYIHMLEKFRNSETFWKDLSTILNAKIHSIRSSENLQNHEILFTAYRYQCQAAVLGIIVWEMFIQRNLSSHYVTSANLAADTFKGDIHVKSNSEIYAPSIVPIDILSTLCESFTLDNLIKSCSPCGYIKDVILQAKMTVCLCAVHIMAKLQNSNDGSLSVSLVEKIHAITKKLCEHPTFSALLGQYCSHGYSVREEVTRLVLNDLYYHMQGELEGREISPGPFKELSNFLLELEIFECNMHKVDDDILPCNKTMQLFDVTCLQSEFQIKLWDYSDWKASKEVAERMFRHMHHANSMMFLSESKNLVLEALIAALTIYEGHMTGTEPGSSGLMLSECFSMSSITYLCKYLQEIVDSLVSPLKPPELLLRLLVSNAELLLNFSRILSLNSERTDKGKILPVDKGKILAVFPLLIKTSGLSIRLMVDVKSSSNMQSKVIKVLFMLLLSSLEFTHQQASVGKSEVDLFAEASLSCLGLLPVVCKFIENTKYSDLAVASLDMMLKHFLTPDTWLPLLREHLQLQVVVQLIQQKRTLLSTSIILNFFLTLARISGGAKMLRSAKFFSSFKGLLSHFLKYGKPPINLDMHGHSNIVDDDKCKHIRGLVLAISTSMISSLGDDSSCSDIIESMIHYFSVKTYFLSDSLVSLKLPDDDHGKKRARLQKTQTSLVALKETENALALICVLAKYQAQWSKGMKVVESDLRESTIHLLACISKGVQHFGDSPYRTTFICPPVLKEEVAINGKPSFISSKSGWFKTSTSFLDQGNISATPTAELGIVVRDQGSGNANGFRQSQFSDTVAVQIYKIAFFLLKFLCMEAKAAVKRAEEVEFIDLAHFPELPMPEILHGLQDQAISVVTDICKVSSSKAIDQEAEDVCSLMLQILEKSLYLEFCVSQSCGIRPVLGRVEDFCKDFKVLMQVVGPHAKLQASLRSSREIVELVYPGISQASRIA